MQAKTVVKLIAFNGALSILNILIFSQSFLGIEIIGGSPVSAAFGVTVIVISVILFFYINYQILKPKVVTEQEPVKDKGIQTLDDCHKAVNDYIKNNVKTFHDNLQSVLSQINRMKKKKTTIQNTLAERFDVNELSYQKFFSAVVNIEEIMILNIKSLLNRIHAFDEEEYEKLMREQYNYKKRAQPGSRSERIVKSRLEIYNDYKNFVQEAVENNEEMLIRLDQLLLEITKLNSLSSEEIDRLDAMKEIDDLIRNTKWYR